MGNCLQKPSLEDSPTSSDLDSEPESLADYDEYPRAPQTEFKSKLITGVSVNQVYKLGERIGMGGFAEVVRATHRQTGIDYACKVMELPPEGKNRSSSDVTREEIFREIDILCHLDHPNVMYMYEYYSDKNNVYLITELLQGGDLYSAITSNDLFPEKQTRECFYQLMSGLAYIHSQGIVHRDIKLDNILLVNPADISSIKIADFGLAKERDMGPFQTVCGTPQYAAPEILYKTSLRQYSFKVDMWSSGCILYVILSGYHPFYHENDAVMYEKIRRAQYNFEDPVWRQVSEEARDLVSRLLKRKHKERLSAQQVLDHPWLQMVTSGTLQKNGERISKWRLRDVVHAVIAVQRMKRVVHQTKSREGGAGFVVANGHGDGVNGDTSANNPPNQI